MDGHGKASYQARILEFSFVFQTSLSQLFEEFNCSWGKAVFNIDCIFFKQKTTLSQLVQGMFQARKSYILAFSALFSNSKLISEEINFIFLLF